MVYPLRARASRLLVSLLASTTPVSAADLSGWVDLHAHPATHLAFGRKLIHGAPDVGSLIPADADCDHDVTARDINHALGHDKSTHGGWNLFNNPCGDNIREQVIDQLQASNGAVQTPQAASGAPSFPDWPRWNDITHQKMWIDWIKRAHSQGLRVMVALATNNKTLGDAVAGSGDAPTDDKASGDLQIKAITELVSRHTDFMEVAYSAADVRRIVGAGKLAIVLGLELDAFGNFYGKNAAPSESKLKTEITRLYNLGVRYIFPVHTIDNHLGGSAVYENAFNLSNYREAGHFWNLACSKESDKITYHFDPENPGTWDAGVMFVKATKLGVDVLREPPDPPSCSSGQGHINAQGLTALGRFAVREMMRQGFLIDIDHMSQRSANETLLIAAGVYLGGYPINSGHNEPRGSGGSENSRTTSQIKKIAAMQGMFGLGIAKSTPAGFIQAYLAVTQAVSGEGDGFVAIGSDVNGLEFGARPVSGSVTYDASFKKLKTGNRTWDYNTDGLANYGLMPDFIRAIGQASSDGSTKVVPGLNKSAEYFARMWEQVETQRASVKTSPNTLVHAPGGDFNHSHEDTYVGYSGWDGTRYCARVYGQAFLLAPGCDWDQAYTADVIGYRDWNNAKWKAKLSGKTFNKAPNGDFDQAVQGSTINYLSGGSQWSFKVK